MADEVRTIRIVIDSSKAVDGGRAAQKALEDIDKSVGGMAASHRQRELTITGMDLVSLLRLIAFRRPRPSAGVDRRPHGAWGTAVSTPGEEAPIA